MANYKCPVCGAECEGFSGLQKHVNECCEKQRRKAAEDESKARNERRSKACDEFYAGVNQAKKALDSMYESHDDDLIVDCVLVLLDLIDD